MHCRGAPHVAAGGPVVSHSALLAYMASATVAALREKLLKEIAYLQARCNAHHSPPISTPPTSPYPPSIGLYLIERLIREPLLVHRSHQLGPHSGSLRAHSITRTSQAEVLSRPAETKEWAMAGLIMRENLGRDGRKLV